MRISEIPRSAEYRMDEQFQICQFLEPNLSFQNCKNSRNLLIFQFEQFEGFTISKILKMSNLEHYKNLQFVKFEKCSIWKVPKICILESF